MLKAPDMNLAYDMKVNRLPGFKELCQKKQTQFVLDKFKSLYPTKFTFQPDSWRIPEDLDIIKDMMDK